MRDLKWALIVLVLIPLAYLYYRPASAPIEAIPSGLNPEILSRNLSSALELNPSRKGEFPNPLPIQVLQGGPVLDLRMNYTIDKDLQALTARLLKLYHPDYAAVVVMNAKTGALLAMASFEEEELGTELVLKGRFPAASVFKIITAAAAVDQKLLEPSSLLKYQGANHTLYRRNVYASRETPWTRELTLGEAFSKSINTVFARIGVYMLTPNLIEEYSRRFFFNQNLQTDIPVEFGQVTANLAEDWERAEVASGFNHMATLSPVHGAMMAAAIANDGVMMQPFLVRSVRDEAGFRYYLAKEKSIATSVSPETALRLREMMQKTVLSGTSRGTFRTLLRNKRAQNIEFGGKTGSLTNLDPKAKCDWFVGYGRDENSRIAVSVVTLHEDYWRVKSSYLARALLEEYFLRKNK